MRPIFLIVAGIILLVIGGALSGQEDQAQYDVRRAIQSGDVEAARRAAGEAYDSGGLNLFSGLLILNGMGLVIFGAVQAFRTRSRLRATRTAEEWGVMKFTTTQKLKTKASEAAILAAIAEIFQPISESVKQGNHFVEATHVQGTFGSINRKDTTRLTIKQKQDGWVVTADTDYKPSTWFWILLVITILTLWGVLISVGIYWWQRTIVKGAIENALKNLADDLEDAAVSPQATQQPSGGAASEVEQLASLLQKGLISQVEFEAAKKRALGIAIQPAPQDPFPDDNLDHDVFVRRNGNVQKTAYKRSALVKSYSRLLPTDEFSYDRNGAWTTRDSFFS